MDEDKNLQDVQPTPTESQGIEQLPDLPSPNPESELKEQLSKQEKTDVENEEDSVSLEYEGGLSDNMIADGLSQLGRSADGAMQVYLTLFLPACELTAIEPLAEYINLQSVTLSYNSLTDLSPLGSMTNLIFLDVSHNNLTTLLDFKPPQALRHVNYSHNKISEIPDLSKHQSLISLNLDYNSITEIKGLQGCCNLKRLSLMHNKIDKIAQLDNFPLQALNLSYNKIKKIENLETLNYLQNIDLAKNTIRSMKGLQNHTLIQDVNLEENQIIDIAEVRYIRELKLLRKLNLLHNPIQEMPDYRLSLLFRIQSLTELDKAAVTPNEKVAAINLFNPPLEVIAARDHMLHIVRSLLEPNTIYDSTLPSVDTPYPMLILCGPSGAGKKLLAKRLCQDFPDFFGLGISHTTRPPRNKEENGEDYFFVSKDEFEAGVMSGKFLQTCQVGSYLYGVTREAVESVARQGLAAVLHMEFEGMLSFKNTYFEPRYILVVPINRQFHQERMTDRGYYTDSQVQQSLDRVELYLTKHRDCPGFFDMAINSDYLSDTYKRLKRLIIEYLGMSPPPSTEMHQYSTSEGSLYTEDESYRVGLKSGTSNTSMTLPFRTWSRPSASSNAKKTSNDTQKTPVEQLSFVRRQNLAKAAVAGIHVLSHEDLNMSRYINSAGFRDSTKHGQKRASSYPLGYDASFVSMTVNASSGNKQTESTESADSDDEEETNTSSVMSSARAYSERFGTNSPDDETGNTGNTLDILTVEFGSQASESVALSAGLEQYQDANSI